MRLTRTVWPPSKLRDVCKIEINGGVYEMWLSLHWWTTIWSSPSWSSFLSLPVFWRVSTAERGIWLPIMRLASCDCTISEASCPPISSFHPSWDLCDCNLFFFYLSYINKSNCWCYTAMNSLINPVSALCNAV